MKKNSEYTVYIFRFLPEVGSSRGGVWVTRSFYQQARSHENKHVKVDKHYGKVLAQFEAWQKGKSACGRDALEQKLSDCKAKAIQIFEGRTATHAAHTAETLKTASGWIPLSWKEEGLFSHSVRAKVTVFTMTGDWNLNLPEIKLECDN